MRGKYFEGATSLKGKNYYACANMLFTLLLMYVLPARNGSPIEENVRGKNY